MGLRNAKTFRRCEEPLGIDTESIEIGQKFFRMLDEEHLLYNFSAASLIYSKTFEERPLSTGLLAWLRLWNNNIGYTKPGLFLPKNV